METKRMDLLNALADGEEKEINWKNVVLHIANNNPDCVIKAVKLEIERINFDSGHIKMTDLEIEKEIARCLMKYPDNTVYAISRYRVLTGKTLAESVKYIDLVGRKMSDYDDCDNELDFYYLIAPHDVATWLKNVAKS